MSQAPKFPNGLNRRVVLRAAAAPTLAAVPFLPARAAALAAGGPGTEDGPPQAPIVTGRWVHALTAFGEPRYPADYPHRAYADPAAPKGGTLRLSNGDRRSSFDKLNMFTLKGNAPIGISMFMVESLCEFSMDEPASLYGLLAESMLVAPDLSTFTLRLRPEARFSNGDPVLAADVVDSVRRQQGPQVQPTYASPLSVLSGVEALDERTVRFHLKERTLDAVFNVGMTWVFSRKWGQGKPLKDIVDEPPIASGPYLVDKTEMPSRIEFRLNPAYWARDLPVRRGFFNFERVAYNLYNDVAVRREAFKAGDFHLMRELSSSAFERLHAGAKWRDGRIVKRAWQTDHGSLQQAMDFNLRRSRFQDIRVREALMRAWDYEAMDKRRAFVRCNSEFNNSPFAAVGLPTAAEQALLEPFRHELPATVFGPPFRAPVNQPPPRLRENLKIAARLLTEAGWTVGADGFRRNAKGELLTLEYLLPSKPAGSSPFGVNLLKLGVKYTERQVDFAIYRRRLLETRDYDLVVIVEGNFTLPNAADLHQIYHSSGADAPGSYNFRGVKSPAVDALIDRIARARTMDELVAASRALDRVIMWNHWQIPQLYSSTERTSYWNRFGIPTTQARYFQVDSIPDAHSNPWPLWCWWDLASDRRPRPATTTG
jgi:microcin C transport system substrate-binding protein